MEEQSEAIKLTKQADVILNSLRQLGVDSYQYDVDDMNILNPLFGFKNGAASNGLNHVGCSSIWMSGGASRIIVDTWPFGYGRNESLVHWPDMTQEQREGIVSWLQDKLNARIDKVNESLQNRPLEDVLPEIEAWAKEYVRKHYRDEEIELVTGRRQCDGDVPPYRVLLCSNQANIKLSQDRFGAYWYSERAPLCGESSARKFTMENYRERLAQAIDWCMN